MSGSSKEDDIEDIPFSRRPKISILNSEDVDKVVNELRGTVEEKIKIKKTTKST